MGVIKFGYVCHSSLGGVWLIGILQFFKYSFDGLASGGVDRVRWRDTGDWGGYVFVSILVDQV